MSASPLVADLHSAAPLIAPSLLSCDFAHVEREIRGVEQAGARILHLDIMDGVFVPNISFGLPVVKAIRRVTELPLDVHLMITDPGSFVKAFRDAGADLITFHIEAVDDPRPLLDEIRRLGAGAGITLNPPTPVENVEGCLPYCDFALVMSVMPGFGGQTFDPVAVEKLRRLRAVGGDDLLLSVDGGICLDTIGPCAEAGADLFVAGSAVFSQNDYRQTIKELTDRAISCKNTQA